MSPTEPRNAIRRQLMHWQSGKCERCGKPLGETVQFIRIDANEGGVPAWIRPGHMMAVHPACAIAPDPQHTCYVPGCGCAHCAALKAAEEYQGPRMTPLDVHCRRCGAKPGVPCTTNPDGRHGFCLQRVAVGNVYDCPYCGSAAGWPCRTRSGHRTQMHKSRSRR